MRPRLAALVLVVAVVTLQIGALGDQSLVWDAPYHLVAGYQALRYGTNTLNLEHPPLVKMVAALPWLGMSPPPILPLGVDSAMAAAESIFADAALVRRARIGGRGLLLLFFGLPFLAASYGIARYLGGPRAGWALTTFLGLSFAVIPYLTIITTDAAVACGYVLTALALLLFLRRPDTLHAAGTGAALGLALSAKFSGLLLIPSVALAVMLADPGPETRRPRLRRWAWLVVILSVASLAVYLTYAVANRNYDPARGRSSLAAHLAGRGTVRVEDRLQPYRESILALGEVHPESAQWLTGLLGIRAQNRIGVFPSYAFGQVRSNGRWWYFPAIFLIKTPLILLAALALALGAGLRGVRGRGDRRPIWILISIPAVYLGVALTSSYNLGMRYLLPVLPFLYLPAALWASRRASRLAWVGGLLALDAFLLWPGWMAATNTWWLGSWNPTRAALSDSNFDYGQSWIELRKELERRGIARIHVIHPVTETAEIRCYLPGAVRVDPEMTPPGKPLDSGWYAVAVMLEQYVPALLRTPPGKLYHQEAHRRLAERYRPLLAAVTRGEDHGWVAGTFHLYRLEPSTARPEVDENR